MTHKEMLQLRFARENRARADYNLNPPHDASLDEITLPLFKDVDDYTAWLVGRAVAQTKIAKGDADAETKFLDGLVVEEIARGGR